MSEGVGARGSDSSFDLLLRRTALRHGSEMPDPHTLIGWARCLASVGEQRAAALMCQGAHLRQGFSRQLLAERQQLPEAPARPKGWTLDLAVTELRALARGFWAECARGFDQPTDPGYSGRPDNPAGLGRGIPAAPAPRDIAETVKRTCALMAAPTADAEALLPLLSQLVEAGRRVPQIDYRSFADASPALLCATIALRSSVKFAMETRDLWERSGSVRLLHGVARCDSAGLGPYIGNIGRIARSSRDLFDLARIAHDAAAAEGDPKPSPEPWILLLSRGCTGALLAEVIDDLGDANAGALLTAILDRQAGDPRGREETVMRIRDAGLDNGDLALAERAQALLVALRPGFRLEEFILATIQASGGQRQKAEILFGKLLAERPDDGEARARLIAVRNDAFAPFVIDRGFGSPAVRQELRLRRRSVVPEYVRRASARIDAVHVG